MSLLTICQNAADEININRPSSIISNLDPEVTRLLRYANKVGRRLAKVPKNGWQIMRKEQTFTGLGAEEQTAILPSDFDRFVPETFWDRTNDVLISGPINAVEWQGFKAGSASNRKKFIYRGDSIFISPALSGGENLAFEYVSDEWCQSSGSVGQSLWAADDDTGILDEELMTLGIIFQFLQGSGQPSVSAAADFEDYCNTLLDNDQPNVKILTAGDIFGGGRHFGGVPNSNGDSLF